MITAHREPDLDIAKEMIRSGPGFNFLRAKYVNVDQSVAGVVAVGQPATPRTEGRVDQFGLDSQACRHSPFKRQ